MFGYHSICNEPGQHQLLALLPVPFFWWIPMRYRVPTTSAVGVAAMLVVPLRKVSFPVVSRVSAPTDVPASVMRTTRTLARRNGS